MPHQEQQTGLSIWGEALIEGTETGKIAIYSRTSPTCPFQENLLPHCPRRTGRAQVRILTRSCGDTKAKTMDCSRGMRVQIPPVTKKGRGERREKKKDKSAARHAQLSRMPSHEPMREHNHNPFGSP